MTISQKYIFGHKIGQSQKFKIPTPRALTRTLAASFKPNMATICEVVWSAQSSTHFTPILANFIKSPKSTSFFWSSPKKPIPPESPTSWLQISNDKPSQIMDPSPRKNYFSVARSEK